MSFRRAMGSDARRRRTPLSQLVDLTPLIDVTFQLLIFFLLTATFQNNPSFRVKLPKAKNQDTTTEPKAIVVSIGTDGTLEVENKVVDLRELAMRLCAAAEADPSTMVNIRADENAAHKYVVSVFDAAKTCGLERMGVLHGR